MKIGTNANYYPYLPNISSIKDSSQRNLPTAHELSYTGQSLDCVEPVYWIDSDNLARLVSRGRMF